METTSYGKAWRAFQKQNFGLCSTTYYSTVPIICRQTWIHRTQSRHYDKSLKRSSLWHIIATNFVCYIQYRSNVSYHRLARKSGTRGNSRNAGKIKSVSVIRAALWAEKLWRCLENCRSWKSTIGKLVVAVNIETIWFEFWMNWKEHKWQWRFLSSLVGDSQIKSVLYSVGDTFELRYCWVWAVVSYTKLATVSLKQTGTFASESKAMCLS